MSQTPQPTMPSMIPEGSPDDPNSSNYYQESDLTGGLPINLDSLRDGPPGTKPFYPYSTLIRYAIKGSPNGKLLLEDIYYAIESRFPYFRTAPNGWKNSVRHNLSLNPCFEKVPRPLTDRGKGSYWTVNDNVDPRTGVHRVRKKKPKGGKASRNSEEEGDGDGDYRPPNSFSEQQYVAPGVDEAASNRQPPFPPYPPFDPNLSIMNMRAFPPIPGMPMPISPEEGFELDEHGQVNWHMAWLKEIGHLQQVTAEQEKAGADQEWYRMMLFRVRGALMPPLMNPDGTIVHMPPHIAVASTPDSQSQPAPQ